MSDSTSAQWVALAADVHVVAIGEELVFLDVAQDRYACLAGAAAMARPDAARGGLHILDAGLVAELRAAGLTTDDQVDRLPWCAPPSPDASMFGVDVGRPRWGDLGEAARAMADLRANYRGRTLHDLVLTEGRAAPSTRAASAPTQMLDAVSRFHRWAPYAPTSPKCLLRAFMLLRLLRRQGHDAWWVFGVRTWPFKAHCWLQVGGVVLDDGVDRVSAYEPILVV